MKRLIQIATTLSVAFLLQSVSPAFARDVDVDSTAGEIDVYLNPGEPTQVEFPSVIAGGHKRKDSTLVLDKKDSSLVVFANQKITTNGEAFIVRLEDGRSYSIRAKRATKDSPRDDFLNINDNRGSIVLPAKEEDPAYKEKQFEYAPPSKISGLMREMVLVAEFGKSSIAGYRRSEKYKGQLVLDDGAMRAEIDSIFIGPDLWGYVINAENLLDQTQKINPATFRLDGTRAVSASTFEMAPRPLNVEQQIASKDKAKIYIVTRAR
ncbi:MAG: hypothetical protein H6619_06830 [Deltaproteobacteria bacterium]|nr:hypothetical protein [Deltaproteobacteria bacterium]